MLFADIKFRFLSTWNFVSNHNVSGHFFEKRIPRRIFGYSRKQPNNGVNYVMRSFFILPFKLYQLRKMELISKTGPLRREKQEINTTFLWLNLKPKCIDLHRMSLPKLVFNRHCAVCKGPCWVTVRTVIYWWCTDFWDVTRSNKLSQLRNEARKKIKKNLTNLLLVDTYLAVCTDTVVSKVFAGRQQCQMIYKLESFGDKLYFHNEILSPWWRRPIWSPKRWGL